MLNADQLDSVRAWARAGARRAEAALRRLHTKDSALEIRDLRCAPLSEFPERLYCFDDAPVAGVMTNFGGGIRGSSLLAMAPADALAWVRAREACADPVAAFLELAREVQNCVVGAIGEGLGAAVILETARLHEDTVPVILFGTHAPSDTVILCLRAMVAAGDEVLPVYLYTLLESKLLGCLIAA